MSLSVASLYGVRFCTKLPLPRLVQDNIAKLRITAAAYKPVRHAKPRKPDDNWRTKTIAAYVSQLKNKDDPEYGEMFAIFNKLNTSNLDRLTEDALKLLAKRDHEFRLRVSTLLFNKAITEHMYSEIMANCAKKIIETYPDFQEDLVLHATMFPTLYDSATTLVYPSTDDPDFENKVVDWTKQKEKRRGYAKFLTQLFMRSLVSEDLLQTSITQACTELSTIAQQAKSDRTEENVNRYVDFLFESAKILPPSTALQQLLKELLARPRTELPSLGMRSRFRLEDALKNLK